MAHAIEPFHIKEGARLPVLLRYLEDSDGNPVPVPSYGIAFHLRASGAATAGIVPSALASVNLTATTTNSFGSVVPAMLVAYSWDADDTATIGYYEGELEAIYAPSQSMKFPDPGFIPIIVGDAA